MTYSLTVTVVLYLAPIIWVNVAWIVCRWAMSHADCLIVGIFFYPILSLFGVASICLGTIALKQEKGKVRYLLLVLGWVLTSVTLSWETLLLTDRLAPWAIASP
jgi:hypothetical protein